MLLSFCGNGAENFLLIGVRKAQVLLYVSFLIPTFRKQTVSHAAKTKPPKRYAPHPFLAKILTANASKFEKEKAMLLSSTFRTRTVSHAAKTKHPKRYAPSSF